MAPQRQVVNNQRKRGWQDDLVGDPTIVQEFSPRDFTALYEWLNREYPRLTAELVLGIDPRAFLR